MSETAADPLVSRIDWILRWTARWAFSGLLNRKIDQHLKLVIRERVVEGLHRLLTEGQIPESINLSATRVRNDRSTLIVDLPVKLRVFVDDRACMRRRYVHDCIECRFLAHALGADLYYCAKQATGPTVIARRSSGAGDYESGLHAAIVMKSAGLTTPLSVALDLAREDGLLQ